MNHKIIPEANERVFILNKMKTKDSFNKLWEEYIKSNPDYAWSEEEKETAYYFYMSGGANKIELKSTTEILQKRNKLIELLMQLYFVDNAIHVTRFKDDKELHWVEYEQKTISPIISFNYFLHNQIC